MVHVGVDVHKRVSQIAVLSATGEVTQHRLENDRLTVHRFFAQVPAPRPSARKALGRRWAGAPPHHHSRDRALPRHPRGA